MIRLAIRRQKVLTTFCYISDDLKEPDFETAPLLSPISITSNCVPAYVLHPQLPTFECPAHLLQPIRLAVADNNSTNPCHILGHAQGAFAAKGRQLIMQLGSQFVLGPPTLDVSGLLQPPDIAINDATDVQTFAKMYMFQFHNIKTADRIALTHLLMLFMRVSHVVYAGKCLLITHRQWLVLPCHETYEDVPWWLRSTAAEDVAPHVSEGYTAPWYLLAPALMALDRVT